MSADAAYDGILMSMRNNMGTKMLGFEGGSRGLLLEVAQSIARQESD
jgi:hypothetical protein